MAKISVKAAKNTTPIRVVYFHGPTDSLVESDGRVSEVEDFPDVRRMIRKGVLIQAPTQNDSTPEEEATKSADLQAALDAEVARKQAEEAARLAATQQPPVGNTQDAPSQPAGAPEGSNEGGDTSQGDTNDPGGSSDSQEPSPLPVTKKSKRGELDAYAKSIGLDPKDYANGDALYEAIVEKQAK